MGWRYRKSINLGGGFKINLSKSGIGYSWGFPGYRYTHSANGSIRKTYSIPGTGISYVDGKSNYNHSDECLKYDENTKLITDYTKYYNNENISSMGKGDELLSQLNKVRTIDIIANLCIFSIALLPIGIILKILILKKWKIDLTYEMDDINTDKFACLNDFLKELSENKKIWQVRSFVNVYNTKYNAGASSNVMRFEVSVFNKMPWYISHNIDVYCLNLADEKIYFTPDRMLIFKKIGGIGVRSYRDMNVICSYTNFVETEFVPQDSKIDHYTWTYVNKDGGPDMRFNDNKKIPVCKYGDIQIQTSDGINIRLINSNYQLISTIESKFKDFMNYHSKKLKNEKANDSSKNETIYGNSSINKNDKWNYYNDEFYNNISEQKIENQMGENDPLYNEILQYVVDNEKVSISLLQRRFILGYNRAAAIMDSLEEKGIIEPQKGEQLRNVVVKNIENSKQINLEQINNPVVVNKGFVEDEDEENVTNPLESRKVSIINSVLCYIQVSFSIVIILACAADKMLTAGICWTLIALIFIPKAKDIIIEKYPPIKDWIIPLRIVLLFLGFILIALTAPTY